MTTPLATALDTRRAIIPHVDDLGLNHGANAAFLHLAREGHVTCGAVMVPCPWFPELADAAAQDPTLDIGIHLTLTSDWPRYRWRPISTVSRASGLIDDDGYFWRDIHQLRAHLVPEAAEAELRAQIDTAIVAGVRPTHIDAHCAAAMLPELLGAHVRLAQEYRVVPVLPRICRFAPDQAAYATAVATLDKPLPDAIRGTLPVPEAELATGWQALLRDLPEGVTHLALHASTPGDIAAINAQHAPWRTQEYALFARGDVTRWCAEHGIALVGYRAIQRLWWPEA